MIDFCLFDSMAMEEELIEKFEEGTEDPVTGHRETLTEGDERIIILKCMNYMAECIFNKINAQANNNLVLFCDEPTLIYKGIERNVYRLPAEQATTQLWFKVSDMSPDAVLIPKGTKATADGKIFFETLEDINVAAGESARVAAKSTTSTASANGYTPGQINVLANTIPYVDKVSNTTMSSGGTDEEDIEAFRKRVLFAPLAYTSTGTEAAYKQKTKEVSASIADVAVAHDNNDIYVYILCTDGGLPGEELIKLATEYLTKPTIKAETDNITVKPAEQVKYSINLEYKVAKADQTRATEIQQNVEDAINSYIESIGTEMGHAINPEMLKKACYVAGAASVDVISPSYTELEEYEVALCENKAVTYDGIL